jgi:threonine aldolase
MTILPPRPVRAFASDNNSGVHPSVMAALIAANEAHVLAYGDDPFTAECNERFNDLFGRPVDTYLVWGGTGANVVGLATMLRSSEAVICTDIAHINVDEGGSPERLIGTKLIDVPSIAGKLRPSDIEAHLGVIGDQHHVQPKVVSITQSTELGTLYSPAEVRAIADVAHANGMFVHMDGARIANATAALGGNIQEFTANAGVDVLSFGGTKNGMMYGEAIVVFSPELARYAPFLRKQLTQLPSKARFIAAQFNAMLTDELWLRNGAHANGMAARLHAATVGLAGVAFPNAAVANSLFPMLPAAVIDPLRAWCPFYPWNQARNQVRWVTSFDTTSDDVDVFAAGLAALINA